MMDIIISSIWKAGGLEYLGDFGELGLLGIIGIVIIIIIVLIALATVALSLFKRVQKSR